MGGKNTPAIYGFFFEVPTTNLVLFSEVTKASALAPINQVILRFLAVLSLILLVAITLLQFPLARITGPVTELAQLALAVGQGRFDVTLRTKGVGELATLTRAFSTMAAGLVERDQKVALLMEEQAVKARLQGELAIARRIQENLLPLAPLPKAAGVVVASEYISASECAGDWYHYAFDEGKRETTLVVADVSGHGAGSSMFTAMIAALFDQFRCQSGPFDLAGFAKAANDVIFRLGREQWHATMLVARHVAGDDRLDMLIAGHPPPLIRIEGGEGKAPLIGGSSVLGGDLEFTPRMVSLAFPAGSSLLIYTDGLAEAVNARRKAFGRGRIRRAFEAANGDPHEVLRRLLDDWRAYLGGQPPNDDVCILVMRSA
jgi:sigma-B regulation protein RsbU (phosphoserine phosphatase)